MDHFDPVSSPVLAVAFTGLLLGSSEQEVARVEIINILMLDHDADIGETDQHAVIDLEEMQRVKAIGPLADFNHIPVLFKIGDGIETVAPGENEAVLSGTAGQPVIATPADEDIIAEITEKLVFSVLAEKPVIPGAAGEIITAASAKQNIIAALTIQYVPATTTGEPVMAAAAFQRICAAIALEDVIIALAGKPVIPGTALHAVIAAAAFQDVIA